MKRINALLLDGVVVLLVLLTISACKHSREACGPTPDVSKIQIDLNYQSLSDSLVHQPSPASLKRFLRKYPLFRDYFMGRAGYPNDSVFYNSWYTRYQNQGIDTLLQEVHRVFGDESDLKQQFREAFRHMKYYYPDFKPPVILTGITGLENDMLVSDTLIIVGLDFYLGPGARYRPRVYNYIMNQYVPQLVVPSCVMLYGIREPYNANNFSDQTALADMIAYGKSFTFAKYMMPCVPDSVFLWYTSKEMKTARDEEPVIWSRIIEDEVLYTTNHLTKQHYLDPRPATLEISEKCPGRIAQWVGWEIVRKYMDTHPGTTLQQLMQTTDAQALFKESGYRPTR